MSDDKLKDEKARLAALGRYAILGTPEEEPYTQIVGLVRNALDTPMAAVTLIGADHQSFKAANGIDPDDIPLDEAFCTVTVKGRRPLIVPDAENDHRFADYPNVLGKPNIRSYIGVPLASPDGYNIGTVCAMDTKPRAFTDTHAALLESFARLVMDEIERRQIGRTDALTGAMTRRSFLRETEREFFRSARYGRPASLVVFDIDRLRDINDVHGHEVGDQVLQAVGRTSLGKLRQSDAFGRLGGEEFAMLLPETGADDAVICAERLRELVALATVRNGGDPLNVTVSLGVATLTPEMTSAAMWQGVADVALYQAKRAGRNRTVSADVATTGANAGMASAPQAAIARVH